MRARRALVLAHEPTGGGALVSEHLTRRGYAVHEHVVTADVERPNDAAPFPDAAGYELLVPMGSIRSLTDTSEISNWIFDELDMMRAAHRRGTPILGICFGGQLLAAALGGTVEQAPVPEIGWYEIRSPAGAVEGSSPVNHAGGHSGPHGARSATAAPARLGANPVGPGPWFQWHHDRFHPPPDAQVLAVNDNAVQLFRRGRSVGTQFHPEVDYTHLEGFVSDADDDYLFEHRVDRASLLDDMRRHEERNTRQCAALVDWFIDEVAASSIE